MARSQRVYKETAKAIEPPKSTYVSASGKTEKVRTESKHVDVIRSMPSTHYTPAVRERTYTNHIHHYHYSQPFSYYQSQPVVYVGGGYSSAFWWMMAEWDAERRARWLYHNRNVIEREAYERGMRDAEVARHIARMESNKEPVNSDYVDPEFKDDPSLMYSTEYVEAAYNPVAVTPPRSSFPWQPIVFVMVIFVVGGGGVYLVFVHRWGK